MLFADHCKQLLDESMKKHIPDWDQLSPADPLKVFSEGVLGSLIEIESLSYQRTQKLLGLFPAFFGFRSRKAMAPSGWFRFNPSETLNAPWILPKGTTLQFEEGDQIWDIVSLADTEILPISLLENSANDSRFSLTIQVNAACAALNFTYLPRMDEDRTQSKKIYSVPKLELSKWDSKQQQYVSISSESYKLQLSSNDWSRSVRLSLRPTAKNRFLFCEKDLKIRAELIFNSDEFPSGTLDANLVHCKLIRSQYSLDLGSLNGSPWEELLLPKEIIDIPDRLELTFPNGKTLYLDKVEDEILYLSQKDLNTLTEKFIYDPVRHALIIPAAFILVKQFQGGVTVQVGPHDQFPPKDWVDAGAKPIFNGFGGKIETVLPFQPEAPRVSREAPHEYLGRFYSAVKGFMTSQLSYQTSILDWNAIELDLLGTSSLIENLEMIPDEKHSRVTLFVMGISDSDRPCQYPSNEIKAGLENRLRYLLPIDYTWKIVSFERVPLDVVIEVDIDCPPNRFIAFRKELLEDWLKQQLRTSPVLSRFDFDYANVLRNLPDHPEFPKTSEIKKIRIWNFHSQTREILSQVQRQPGQFFDPNLKLSLRFSSNEESFSE